MSLEEQVSRILGSPGAMAQISKLAEQLFPGTQGPEPDAAPPAGEPTAGAEAGSGPDFGGADGALLQQLAKAVQSDKIALVHALGPYLTQDRRERLERAVQLAHLATLARQALQQIGGESHV